MKKGKFSTRSTCRLCDSKDLKVFFDFGMMPLAGDYLKFDQIGEEFFYPLALHKCNSCSLVQVLTVIESQVLFSDYRYLSSVGLKEHFNNYATEVVDVFNLQGKQILEIGSNDGVLLAPLKEKGVHVLGIDPAANIAHIANSLGLTTLVDFFGLSAAIKIEKEYGKMSAIFANNVLAHIDTMDDIFKGIKYILASDGVLIFEVHYLVDLIKKVQYDFFYHEHMSYYTLTSLIPFLNRFDLEVFDVKKVPIHSGSIRLYVKFKNNSQIKISLRVRKLLKTETVFFGKNDVFENFAKKVFKSKTDLISLLSILKKQNKKIIGYGAAGRGNTLLNYCGITTSQLSYIVDSSPERYGRHTPGSHIPIVPPSLFHDDAVDYVVLLAWNYTRMIIKKEGVFKAKGGVFIIPLPRVSEL